MNLTNRVNVASVENNWGDRKAIKDVYHLNVPDWREDYGLDLPDSPIMADNAVAGLKALREAKERGDPARVMLIDRDLEFTEDPVLLGPEVGMGYSLEDRTSPEEARDGVYFLAHHLTSDTRTGEYHPLVVAAFYTADRDKVLGDSRLTGTILPLMEAGVGPIVIIQPKMGDPTNELNDLFDAAFIAYKGVLEGLRDTSMQPGQFLANRMRIGQLFKEAQFHPGVFLQKYLLD